MSFTTVSIDGHRSCRMAFTTGTDTGTLGDTDGLNLDGMASFTVHAYPSGAVFVGSGTLAAYLQSPATLSWSRSTAGDLSFAGTSGSAAVAWVPNALPPSGRVAYLPSGVLLSPSSSLGVTVDFIAVLARGDRPVRS